MLFILYINDIASVSKLLKCILFADDTPVFYSVENINSELQIVQSEVEKIVKWFSANKMFMNL